MNEQLHAIVSGRVQGVSFRYYTMLKARELNLVGWVRNREDGSVEVVAEGPPLKLQDLVAFLAVGSPAARVKDVKTTLRSASADYTEFSIRR